MKHNKPDVLSLTLWWVKLITGNNLKNGLNEDDDTLIIGLYYHIEFFFLNPLILTGKLCSFLYNLVRLVLSTVDYYSVLLYLFDSHKLNLHWCILYVFHIAHLCNFVLFSQQLYKLYSLCRNTVLTLDCVTSVNELAYSECRHELLCMFLKCPAQSWCCVLPIFLQSPIGSGELHLYLLQKRRHAHN